MFDEQSAASLSVELRPACADDGLVIARLDESSDAYPWTQSQCQSAARGDGNQQAWVLELAQEIVGFMVVSKILDELTILRIAVHPHYRRRGYASGLHAALFDQLLPAECSIALLEVRQSNKAAQRFYASSGFELDGIRKNYYPDANGREDAVLMSRRL